MKKYLSILLISFISLLCPNNASAWNFWAGSDKITIFNETTQSYFTVSEMSIDGGTKFVAEFTADRSEFEWKYVVNNNTWRGNGEELTPGEYWKKISDTNEHGKNKLVSLTVGATYQLQLGALSNSANNELYARLVLISGSENPVEPVEPEEKQIFSVYYRKNAKQKASANDVPYIWLWKENSGTTVHAGEYYSGNNKWDDRPSMTAVAGSETDYYWTAELTASEFPNCMIVTEGKTGTQIEKKNEALNGMVMTADGNLAVYETPLSNGWTLMGQQFGDDGVAMKKLEQKDLNGNDVWSIELDKIEGGMPFWFEDGSEQSLYANTGTEPLNCEDELWITGCDTATDSDPFSSIVDYENVTIYIRQPSNEIVMVYTDDDFNPLYATRPVPEGAAEIVWFGGVNYQYFTNVKFILVKNDGSEESMQVWAAGDHYWEAADGFFGAVVNNIDGYKDVKIQPTFSSDTPNSVWNDDDKSPIFSLAGKDNSVAKCDYDNWYKFILGAYELDMSADGIETGAGNVVYQSYCTPDRFRKENNGEKQRLIILGKNFQMEVNGKNLAFDSEGNGWTIANFTDTKPEIPVYNGVATVHFSPIKVGNERQRPIFKLTWMPLFDIIQDNDVYGATLTAATANDKRAWTTFNLGLFGGYDSNTITQDNDNVSFIRFISPILYNNYSQVNWSWDDDVEDMLDKAEGSDNEQLMKDFYLLVDTDRRFKSMTILPYNPVVKLVGFNIGHTADDYGFDAGHNLMGSDTGAYARPTQINDMNAAVDVRPAYLELKTDEQQQMIKDKFTIDYYFYNCEHDFEPGENESSAKSHLGDRLIGVYHTKKGNPAHGSLTNITTFKLNNIVMENVPKMMIQTVYNYDEYEEIAAIEGRHPAKGFRTVPHALVPTGTAVKGVSFSLAENAAFLHAFEENDGTWSLHFDIPLNDVKAAHNSTDEDEKFLASYFEYEATIGDVEYPLEPAWEGPGMPNIFTPGTTHWNWAIEGYTPWVSGDYDDEHNNWSRLMLEKGHINSVIHVRASSPEVLNNLIVTNGLNVTARIKYPFVKYETQSIERVTALAAAPAAKAPRASDDYSVVYATNEQKSVYGKDGDGGVITGIENIATDSASPEYYTLQGIRVSAPLQPGVYLVRRGNQVSKQLIK